MPKIKKFLCLLVLGFTVLSCRPAYAQEPTVTLTANDIMRIVVENMNKNELLKSKFVSFERRCVEYELYRGGQQKSILKDEVSYHGESYPLKLRGGSGGISVNLSSILSLNYDYIFLNPNSPSYIKLPPEYKFDCDECYVIKFEPKRIQPDVANIAPSNAGAVEKGIHETAMRMEGTIFVDKLHLFVKKFAGELGNGLDKGILSSVRISMASLNLEQELRPDLSSIVVLKSAEITYQIRIAWLKYITRKDTWKWSNYRRNQ